MQKQHSPIHQDCAHVAEYYTKKAEQMNAALSRTTIFEERRAIYHKMAIYQRKAFHAKWQAIDGRRARRPAAQ